MSVEQINQSGLICLNIQPCINKATGLKTKRTVRKHEHNTFARWIKLLRVFFSKTKASNVICDDLGRGHSLCNATPRPRDIGLPKTKHPFLNSFTASSTVVQSFFQKFFLYRWVPQTATKNTVKTKQLGKLFLLFLNPIFPPQIRLLCWNLYGLFILPLFHHQGL